MAATRISNSTPRWSARAVRDAVATRVGEQADAAPGFNGGLEPPATAPAQADGSRCRRTPVIAALVAGCLLAACAAAVAGSLLLPESPPCARAADAQEHVALLAWLAVGVQAALAEGGARSYAMHGTALGAVREGRILPWTSDVDVATFELPLQQLTDDVSVAAVALRRWGLHVFFATPRRIFARVCVRAGASEATGAARLGFGGNLSVSMEGIAAIVARTAARPLARRLRWWSASTPPSRTPYADVYGMYEFDGEEGLTLKPYASHCLYPRVAFGVPAEWSVFVSPSLGNVTLLLPRYPEALLAMTYGPQWRAPSPAGGWSGDWCEHHPRGAAAARDALRARVRAAATRAEPRDTRNATAGSGVH